MSKKFEITDKEYDEWVDAIFPTDRFCGWPRERAEESRRIWKVHPNRDWWKGYLADNWDDRRSIFEKRNEELAAENERLTAENEKLEGNNQTLIGLTVAAVSVLALSLVLMWAAL